MLCGACPAPGTWWGGGSESPVAVFEDGSLSGETGLRQEREREVRVTAQWVGGHVLLAGWMAQRDRTLTVLAYSAHVSTRS